MSSNATSNAGAARNEDAVYTVSVAAQLVGMHAQTLRQYDRLGLVSPSRTKGRGRRYSARDVRRLREVQRLTKEEGVNLAGVQLALQLRQEISDLRTEIEELTLALQSSATPAHRVFAADSEGSVIQRPPQPGGPIEVPDLGDSESSPHHLIQDQAPKEETAPLDTGGSRPSASTKRANVPLNVVTLRPGRHGRALARQSDLRGWQQLAAFQLQRRYRDRIDGMLPKQSKPGARTYER